MDRQLLIGLSIHEIIKLTVFVDIRHISTFQTNLLKFLRRIETALNHAACFQILIFGANEGRTLARLNVLELHYLINLTVHFKSYAIPKIASTNHNSSKPILLLLCLEL